MPNFLEETDPTAAAEILKREGISVRSLEPLYQGLDNHTFLLNDELIVRFPRGRWFRMEEECWALEAIAGKTKLKTPVLELRSSGEWPFMGYCPIPGEKLSTLWSSLDADERSTVADQIGEFFAELHRAVAPSEAIAAGIPVEENKTRCDDIKNWTNAPKHWKPFLQECVARVEAHHAPSADHRFLHLDAHGDNIIVDPETRRATGVIDFGDVVVSDPHAEIAIAGFIDLDVLDELIASYVRYSGVRLDRQRVWDLYLVASASDVARESYDCSADVEACYQMWRDGSWPKLAWQ